MEEALVYYLKDGVTSIGAEPQSAMGVAGPRLFGKLRAKVTIVGYAPLQYKPPNNTPLEFYTKTRIIAPCQLS